MPRTPGRPVGHTPGGHTPDAHVPSAQQSVLLDAWGGSWGSSWGTSWGAGAQPIIYTQLWWIWDIYIPKYR